MKLILALAVPFASIVLPLASGKPIHGNRDSGPVKVNLSRRFNFVADGKTTLPQIDRARAAALRDKSAALKAGRKRDGAQPVDNVAVVYTASIGVGEPATAYDLLIDTGSSNTWIGAGQSYVQTSASSDTGDTVSVSYGSGYFSGKEYNDKVTITNSLVIEQQSIGVANESQGLEGYDGILGIGPTILTLGTLSSYQTVPTVTDNLYNAGEISHNAIGIFYAPFTVDNVDGVLSWGGPDNTLYEGSLTYVPVTSTYPSEYYWGIDQRISYGTSNLLTSSGIVDTGTTLILIASDTFAKYKAATGAVEDGATGLLKITAARYASLKGLNFVVGGTTFTLPPNGQIWPRELNVAIGGQQDAIYLIVADLGSDSGQGLDFINGYTFLERFYSVYDTDNGRVGLANTKYTNATTN